MIFDDLYELLKALKPDVHTITKYWQGSGIEEEYLRLDQLSAQENFWQSAEQATILKKLQRLRILREAYYKIVDGYRELTDLLTLFRESEEDLLKIRPEIESLGRAIRAFKITLLLSGPEDDSAAFLAINAGAGGTEAHDWADMLLRMYLRFCEREKFNVEVVDYQPGEGAGIKSATLQVSGRNAYGLLKSEQGIHRLVRISPFDANKRRHTSFVAVSVTPETPEVDIIINQNDLRVDTYRAGGAGGQHVNKTDSAVRITHEPSGIVVQCQSQRSQSQNKETALKMLKARLAQKQKEEQEAKSAMIEKKRIEWGSQIRSYVLHPYKMVKDHRTDIESPQPNLVLDGDLMPFIEAYLILQGAGREGAPDNTETRDN